MNSHLTLWPNQVSIGHMKEAIVRARVDSRVKEESEAVLAELGISTTEAIRMFLAQVRLRKGMPFPLSIPTEDDDLLMPTARRQAGLDEFYDD